MSEPQTISNSRQIGVSFIEENPFQPRKNFNEAELQELADSISVHGILQPILVRPHPDKKKATQGWFQLVSGERRWRAAMRAGLAVVPAIVRNLGDLESREIAFQENLQRQDLSDSEEALALHGLMEAWSTVAEEPLSRRELARRLKKSVTYIANRLDALGYPEDVQEMLGRHRNVLSSAKAIADVQGRERRQKYIAMVDAGKSYANVLSAIQSDDLEIKSQEQANRAPDGETQERSHLNQTGQGGGGSTSRGRTITGGPSVTTTTPTQSSAPQKQQNTNAELEEGRLLVKRSIYNIRAWAQHLPQAEYDDYVMKLGKEIVEGILRKK